jgi:hypothetical protein
VSNVRGQIQFSQDRSQARFIYCCTVPRLCLRGGSDNVVFRPTERRVCVELIRLYIGCNSMRSSNHETIPSVGEGANTHDFQDKITPGEAKASNYCIATSRGGSSLPNVPESNIAQTFRAAGLLGALRAPVWQSGAHHATLEFRLLVRLAAPGIEGIRGMALLPHSAGVPSPSQSRGSGCTG